MIDLKNFEFIYIHHWEKLYAFCFRMTRDEYIAQNIVQDIFTDLWERRKDVNILAIQNYLFSAAGNQVLKEYSKKKFNATIIDDKLEEYLEYLIKKNENQTVSEAEAELPGNFIQDEYDRSEWDIAQMGAKAAISAGIYKNIKKRNQLKKPFRIHYKYAVVATIALVIGLGILMKSQTAVKEILVRKTVTDSGKTQDTIVSKIKKLR